jgi:alkanesulfonate monooxygenase SsuD/methylene tetrahydromethanopterin reductase-like flavin-dependent oxidoreductase (luciferase family)
MLHLGLWMLTTGHHIASWRHPSSNPSAILNLDFYREAARIAEAGKFDMVFFEDTLAARERNGHIFGEVSIFSMDPVVSIAALALVTEKIETSPPATRPPTTCPMCWRRSSPRSTI